MIAIALAAMASAALDPGPRPSWQEAISLGNAALLARLKDPSSALVAWPYSFFGGDIGGLLDKRQAGWITCGLINARNAMGGYSGPAPFLIVIHNGAVAELDIGSPDGIDSATPTCRKLLGQGMFHLSGAPMEPAPIRP